MTKVSVTNRRVITMAIALAGYAVLISGATSIIAATAASAPTSVTVTAPSFSGESGSVTVTAVCSLERDAITFTGSGFRGQRLLAPDVYFVLAQALANGRQSIVAPPATAAAGGALTISGEFVPAPGQSSATFFVGYEKTPGDAALDSSNSLGPFRVRLPNDCFGTPAGQPAAVAPLPLPMPSSTPGDTQASSDPVPTPTCDPVSTTDCPIVLADTGSRTGPLLFGGIGALTVGSLVLLLVRRRRNDVDSCGPC